MLYLAEVQKKTGLMGGRAELKLLACQRSEQNWSAVPGEELIAMPPEQASNYNSGALVLVDLSSSKQVQRFLEAGRQLVNILQNFSRLQERYKVQEEEIEAWKSSLTYQSQELQNRQSEVEAQLEQIQNMEGEFAKLQAERQDLEQNRQQIQQLQAEVERSRQNLEGAWAHLQGEQQRLEEQLAVASQGRGLDQAQAAQFQDMLNRVSAASAPAQALQAQLQQSATAVDAQQEVLNRYWQQLEQSRGSTQRLQTEVDQLSQEVQNRTRAWQEARTTLEAAITDCQVQQATLRLRQELHGTLSRQLQAQDGIYQQLQQLLGETDVDNLQGKVDVAALESMPLEALEKLVQDVQQELQKASRFVADQEEELKYQQQTIDDLQVQIQHANEFDRLQLEADLSEEHDRYQYLNETLVGQRRRLQEREAILNCHLQVLQHRQGRVAPEEQVEGNDLRPIVEALRTQRQQQTQTLQQLTTEIQHLQSGIEQAQASINRQTAAQESLRQDLNQMEQALATRRAEAAECWGRVNIYQEMLQAIQDGLNHLRHTLGSAGDVFSQVQTQAEQQQQAITQMQQILTNLTIP